MRHDAILVRDIGSYVEGIDAIDKIESDYLNFVGGMAAWFSGAEVFLSSAAERKLKAIRRHIDRKFPAEDDC